MLVTCSIGRTSHQSLILYTVARLDTRWRDIEDGNGLPVTAQEWLGMSAVNEGVGDNAHHQKHALEPPSESGESAGGQS